MPRPNEPSTKKTLPSFNEGLIIALTTYDTLLSPTGGSF